MTDNAVADASRASAKIKEELPGRGKEAKKEAESLAHQASAELNKAVSYPSQPAI
jgi:hypothetical protein